VDDEWSLQRTRGNVPAASTSCKHSEEKARTLSARRGLGILTKETTNESKKTAEKKRLASKQKDGKPRVHQTKEKTADKKRLASKQKDGKPRVHGQQPKC
jgi:hypothetical protein